MMEAWSLILLLLQLRIANSFASDFPTRILVQANDECVARIGKTSPAIVELDTEPPGESLPEFGDLIKHY